MKAFMMIGRKIKVAFKNGSWPQVYHTRYLEPGICSYDDVKEGIVMVSNEVIEKMRASFIGKPVYILHPEDDVTPENFKKLEPAGYVTKTYRDPDGWASCDFILTDEKAKKKIDNGYQVSCAYDVTGVGPGGAWHAIKYDKSITDGAMQHLALVPNPRYEDVGVPQKVLVNSMPAKMQSTRENNLDDGKCDQCGKKMDLRKEGTGDKGKIYCKECWEKREKKLYSNSKKIVKDLKCGDRIVYAGDSFKVIAVDEDGNENLRVECEGGRVFVWPKNNQVTVNENKKENAMFKFFKKGSKTEELQGLDLEHTMIDVDGQQVSLGTILNASKSVQDLARAAEVEIDEEFEYAGHKLNLANAVAEYKASKKNETDEEKKKREDEEAKKNAADEKKKKEEEEAKKNCTCGAKDGEEHKKDCKKAAKKNESEEEKKKEEEAKKNAEAEEEKKKEAAKKNSVKATFDANNALRNAGVETNLAAGNLPEDRLARGKKLCGTSK